MSQNFKPETVEQGKEFAVFYRDGWSAREIAERFGCSEENVRRSLIAAGCPRRSRVNRSEKAKQTLDAEIKMKGEKYAVLYRAGWTLREIGEAAGHSHRTISNAIKAAGVPIRSRGCRPNDRLRMAERRKEAARRYVERGEGVYHIAFVLDVTYVTIYTDLKAAGVKIRDRSEHIWRKLDRKQVEDALARRRQ